MLDHQSTSEPQLPLTGTAAMYTRGATQTTRTHLPLPKFEDMTDEQLEEVLQGYFRSMNSLMVRSQIPAEHRAEYRQYQGSVAAIEAEQEKRYQAHPTITMQDTTHYVW